MKRTAEVSDEVRAAVEDILNGTHVDDHTQWLQRNYIRLMRRECNEEKEKKKESKLLEKNFKQQHGAFTDKDRSTE